MMGTRASSPPSPAADLPFKYVGGDASLDLVNTVDWTSKGLVNERITGYQGLARWAEGAGVVSASQAEVLVAAARSRPDEAEAACEEARRLRAQLQRLYRAVVDGTDSGRAWDAFNEQLAAVLPRLRLAPRPPGEDGPAAAGWVWLGREERLDSLLWPVVRAAAELLASEEARQVQICDGPDCGWMYVDRSRNGLRRWCEMKTCGTAAKSRRRRKRTERGRRSGSPAGRGNRSETSAARRS